MKIVPVCWAKKWLVSSAQIAPPAGGCGHRATALAGSAQRDSDDDLTQRDCHLHGIAEKGRTG